MEVPVQRQRRLLSASSMVRLGERLHLHDTPRWAAGPVHAWLPWERARGVDLLGSRHHQRLLDGSSTCEKLAARAPRTP